MKQDTQPVPGGWIGGIIQILLSLAVALVFAWLARMILDTTNSHSGSFKSTMVPYVHAGAYAIAAFGLASFLMITNTIIYRLSKASTK